MQTQTCSPKGSGQPVIAAPCAENWKVCMNFFYIIVFSLSIFRSKMRNLEFKRILFANINMEKTIQVLKNFILLLPSNRIHSIPFISYSSTNEIQAFVIFIIEIRVYEKESQLIEIAWNISFCRWKLWFYAIKYDDWDKRKQLLQRIIKLKI